jgi:UDP-GlcNAc:undecaprenyl-phosphate/decaprenyl-phosphate GlcNAc-1-phosphate transferase
MTYSPILLFSGSLLLTLIILKLFGQKYALDQPDIRKQHMGDIPQIGGLVFGPLLLFIAWWSGLAPQWYLIGGGISILLGTVDDNRHVPWQIKFTVQLALVAYFSIIFWGHFDAITFYNLSFPVSEIGLLFIFLFWFIGIYNSVNLLDGLDGLAGSFMLLLCLGLGFSGSDSFATLNLMLSVILLGFLVFNQRPAKLFMGDAGSLFLGFHTAVLPLLFFESIPTVKTLNMTPFVLLASYLVADTTRVFITRLLAKKNPMTADTIHFHHLILQQSGSYLASIGFILLITLLSVIGGIISFYTELSSNMMLVYFAILLLFILTPPVQTYVPVFTNLIGPLYNWQKGSQKTSPLFLRTIFLSALLIGLIFSLSLYCNLSIISWQHGLAVILLFIFIFFYQKDLMAKYVIQLGLVLFFSELYWNIELGIITKLFTIFLLISYFIFTLEKRSGCNISKFSTLDLLLILITLGGVTLALLGFPVSIWYFLTMFSLWFGTSFLLNRTISYTESVERIPALR